MDADSDVALDILITNVICVFRTRCHLNLRKIALEGANVIYKRDVGKVLMKLRKPRITATIWSSGKIICTGATSEEEAKFGARRLARSLQKLGFQNLQRTTDLMPAMNLNSIPPWLPDKVSQSYITDILDRKYHSDRAQCKGCGHCCGADLPIRV